MRSLALALALVSTTLSATDALAQTELDDVGTWTTTFGDEQSRTVAWGDYDGDGDLDLAESGLGFPIHVYTNTGTGALVATWSSAETDSTNALAWGDLDGDGTLELAAVSAAGFSSRIYLWTGSTFGLQASFGLNDEARDCDFGDWDGDGDDELLVATAGPNRIYDGGSGGPVEVWNDGGWQTTNAARWVDWNNDGLLDAVFANAYQPNTIWLQGTPGALGPYWQVASSNNGGVDAYDDTRDVDVGDYNDDGWPDIAFANYGGINQVFRGVIGGAPLHVWSAGGGNVQDVEFGDFDSDGDDDLAVALDGGPVQVFESAGGNLAVSPVWTSVETDGSYGLAWGDWNGDGDTELAVANSPQVNRVYENLGQDLDGDGFEWGIDCDDDDASIYPGAPELCDSIDSDCDGDLLDDLDDLDGDGEPDCFDADIDGDGVLNAADCAPLDADTYPGAPELADGVDNDCDSTVDETTAWYDDDGDGWAEEGGDCDDGDGGVHPAAVEICDGVDQDCDGLVDNDTACFDDDSDGFSEVDGDCNDGDGAVSPDHPEVAANGVDDDCDGVVDDGATDGDGDGYTAEGGDCDEDRPDVRPGGVEVCDGVDQDCDGFIDEGTECSDDDGDGFAEIDGDCNDDDPEQHPDAEELVPGVDDDCDGIIDDGGGAPDDQEVAEETSDADGDGWSIADGDCDDQDGWVHPQAHEFCDDELDNDCDSETPDSCTTLSPPATGKDVGCQASIVNGGASMTLVFGVLLTATLKVRRRRRGGAIAVVMLATAIASLGGCTMTGLQELRGRLVFGPELQDLGVVSVGQVVPFTVQLDHLDGQAVSLFDIEVLNVEGDAFWFENWSGDQTLERNESQSPVLSFAPQEAGNHWARVTLRTDSISGDMEVIVRGRAALGVVQVGPQLLDFGRVAAGEHGARELIVTNDVGSPLVLQEAIFSDPTYALAAEPTPIPSWDEGAVVIRFSPSDDEPSAAVLELIFEGGWTSGPLQLRGNDCEGGVPSAYDSDGDGFTSCSTDCDDDDVDVRPGAPEVCDGVDQNCDGVVDEGTECFDDDGDGYTELEGDCNDATASVGPAHGELPSNGVDDDCDGMVDDAAEDMDGDGYGPDGGDCDDNDPTSYPDAPEAPLGVPDGLDNNCDGRIDDGTVAFDDDYDGLSELDGDCDDTDSSTFPGAPEVADWEDDDCDGEVDEGTVAGDDDGDGYTEVGGDCDDGDATQHPAAAELANDGVDSNCDGYDDP